MRKFKLHSGKSGAALTLRITPRARKTEFAGVLEDGILRVRVAAPPVEGKANAALLTFLAKVLAVRKNRIEIIAGQRGLDKIVSVLDLSAEEVQSRIQAWLSAQEPE
ncbi:MAG: DUF167 domain-containing protein [Chloroflexi bacterium]|nr:DUF167 domain-containing protein [Chloroflexota bacterium]